MLRKGHPQARFLVCVKELWSEILKASALVLPIPACDLTAPFLGPSLSTCKGRTGLSLRVIILVLLLSRNNLEKLQCA